MAVFLLSLSLSLFGAPLWSRILSRSSWIDAPRADRHHERAVSRAGGAAWAAAVLCGLAAAILGGLSAAASALIIAAVSASFLLGRLDDLDRLRPGQKWLSQTGALAVALAGLHFAGILDLGGMAPMEAGIAAIVALLLQTALGIFDNIDGALSLAAAGALVLAASGMAPDALLPAATAGLGATLGFLAWNLPPARLFLGNAGSQPLALLVSLLVFTVLGRAGGAEAGGDSPWVVLLPLSWPMLDLVFVSVRRSAGGSAPWRGGRDHTTHILARRLGSDGAVFGALLIVTSMATAAGLLILRGAR